MVRYSSRVGAAGNATVKKRGAPKKVGILVKKGSDIAIRGGMEVGGQVEESDLKETLKSIDAVKALPHESANIKKELASTTKSKPVTLNKSTSSVRTGAIESGSVKGSGLGVGGGIFSDEIGNVAKNINQVMGARKGGALAKNLQDIMSKMTHSGMIQVLNHMSPEQFHVLQGVAGAHLPQFNSHPFTGIARKVLGGSFTHPRGISKMATRDITRAVTAQQLATALHSEMMDMHKGANVGGGLLDSLKHGFNRGFEGLKSSLSAGNRIGNVLHSAVSTGIKIGQVFSPVIESLFPGAGELIKTGISGAEALKAGLETGLRAGEALEKGLESISPLVEEKADEPVKAAEVIKELESAADQPVVAKIPEEQVSAFIQSRTLGSGLSKAELKVLGF